MNGEMRILGEIESFTPCAVHDSFEDGALVTYDASNLHVISPGELAGETISIIHSTELPRDSFWRKAGILVEFVVDREYLSDDGQVYDGAVKHPQVVPRKDFSTPMNNR